MTEGIVVALIGFGQAVSLAIIGIIAARLGKVSKDTASARQDAAAARWQVENTHDTNLREENDQRHNETRAWFSELSRQIRTITRDVGGLREEIRDDRKAHRSLADRVTAIEQKDD